MEGKTNFSRRLKQFNDLTSLTLTLSLFYDISTPLPTPYNAERLNRHGNTHGQGRVLGGQPRHCICTNASRGLSAITESLVLYKPVHVGLSLMSDDVFFRYSNTVAISAIKSCELTDAGFDVGPNSISLTRDCLVKDIAMKEMTRKTRVRDVTQVSRSYRCTC